MIVIQDTREKEPWQLDNFKECQAQEVDTVDAGDYIIKGETYITIDRKKSPAELANNLGMHIDRFKRELKRMAKYDKRYVVCEFPYERLLMFPKGSGLPKYVQKKIRVSGKFLVKQVERLSEEFDVKFLFFNDRMEAEERAVELLKGAMYNGY